MKKLLPAILFLFSFNLLVSAQSDIRKIDFKNFTYEPYCAGEETAKVRVKNGEFSSRKVMDGYTDNFYFKAFDFVYGDLTGDGNEEAVVLTVCNTGGTGNFTEGFVFGMNDGKVTLLTGIEGGDRAYGGLREARIENGILIVESNDVGESGGACCPEFVVTSYYKLNGNKLEEAKKSDRYALYPAQRVSFPKGTSGTTLKINVPAQDLKRFVVGARAGQTLTVSINTKNASLRILENADVQDQTTKLTAKLPKNGDYTIEVQNFEETDKEISVTIKIN